MFLARTGARELNTAHLEVIRIRIWRLETWTQLHGREQALGEEDLDH